MEGISRALKALRRGRLTLEDPEKDRALEVRRVWRALGLYKVGRELARAGFLPVFAEPAPGLVILYLEKGKTGFWALAGSERVGAFGVEVPGTWPLEGNPKYLDEVRELVAAEGERFRVLLNAQAEEAFGLLLS